MRVPHLFDPVVRMHTLADTVNVAIMRRTALEKASLLRFRSNWPKLALAQKARFGQALDTRNATHSFGRLNRLDRAALISVATRRRSMAVLRSVEEFKRLKSLESPESRPEREERE